MLAPVRLPGRRRPPGLLASHRLLATTRVILAPVILVRVVAMVVMRKVVDTNSHRVATPLHSKAGTPRRGAVHKTPVLVGSRDGPVVDFLVDV